MLTTQDKQLTSRLIKKYADNISTDTMIAFVADTSGLLSVCKELIKSNNQDDQQTIGWVDEQCFKSQVDVHGFLFEIQQIVSIFQPGQGNTTHYETLGLDEEATGDEVKRAYRKLSRKYHPDTSSSDNAENSNMFVKINKAYHALLEGELAESQVTAPTATNAHWRNSPKNTISRAQKKKNLLWFGALAIVMIVVSLVVASNYKKRVMLAGLQSSRAAFIPPLEPVEKTESPAHTVPSPPPAKKLVVAPEAETVTPISEEEVPKIIELEKEKIKVPVVIVEATNTKQIPETVEKIEPAKQSQFDVKEVQAATKPEPVLPESVAPVSENVDALLSVVEKVVIVPEEKIIEVANPPAIASVTETAGRSTETVKTTEPVEQTPPETKEISAQPPEPVIAETISAPPEKPQESTQQKIERFLTAYTKSYEDKDLLSFTHFYDTKATENGEPLAEIITTYSDLFEKSETIALSVAVLKWNRKRTNIHLDGRFQIHIQYKDGTQVSGKGQIFFLLSELRGQFEIKELTYQFDAQ